MTFTTTRMQIGLSADPDRVFKALTESEAVRAWFSEHAEIDLAAKQYDFWGKYTPTVPDRSSGKHAIVESVPGEILSYRWRVDDHETQVTFRLHPQQQGTLLTLRHAADSEGDSARGVAEDFWFLSLENLRRYLDGKPSDARVDYSSPMRGHIQHETEIDASPERVWDVLTNPDELNRWIATQANIQLEKDGVYGLGWTQADTDYGASKILDIVPGQKLVLELPPFPGQTPTVVTWEMKENNGKTWLTFTHSGFEADQDVSDLHSGWLNFVNWMRSVSEYGAAWVAPVSALIEGAIGYPATTFSAQNQLAAELREIG
jgi:uncharacterized protein YndB with AHSA1/START domain